MTRDKGADHNVTRPLDDQWWNDYLRPRLIEMLQHSGHPVKITAAADYFDVTRGAIDLVIAAYPEVFVRHWLPGEPDTLALRDAAKPARQRQIRRRTPGTRVGAQPDARQPTRKESPA